MTPALNDRTMNRWQLLSRDYAYVLPGFPLGVFAFSLLLSMLITSIATFVVWVGALLLPLTLMTATGFAELSRTRLRLWGIEPGHVTYRPPGPGVFGKLKIATDPRRWLDLAFEMLIAFPLRLVTFVISVVWTVVGPGGLTYFFWSTFIPGERGLIKLLGLIDPRLVPDGTRNQYLLDSGAFLIVGISFLLTLPSVMRGIAWLEALVTNSLLSGNPGGDSASPTSATHHWGTDQLSTGGQTSSIGLSQRTWSWLCVGFVALVLLSVGWPVTAVVYSLNAALAMVLVVTHCGAVLLALRWGLAGILLSLAASGALMFTTAEAQVSVWPWPITAMLTQCAVLGVIALTKPWYSAILAWGAGVALSLGAFLSVSPGASAGTQANTIVMIAASAGVIFLGMVARRAIALRSKNSPLAPTLV